MKHLNGHSLKSYRNIDRLYECLKCNCLILFGQSVGYYTYTFTELNSQRQIVDNNLTCDEIQIKRLLE